MRGSWKYTSRTVDPTEVARQREELENSGWEIIESIQSGSGKVTLVARRETVREIRKGAGAPPSGADLIDLASRAAKR